MPAFRRTVLLFSATAWPVIIGLKAFDMPAYSRVLIPIFVLMTALNAWLSGKGLAHGRLMAAAFVFILLGDGLINLTPYEPQAPLAFGAAHLLLSAYFTRFARIRPSDLIPGLVVLVFSAAFFLGCLRFPVSAGQTATLGLYLAVLSWMAWRGWCLFRDKALPSAFRALVLAGVLLFYVTDLAVIAGYIVPMKALTMFVWIFYPVSLFCLSSCPHHSPRM